MQNTTHTPERTLVQIEGEHTGKITLSADEFDLLIDAAVVGLDGYGGINGGTDVAADALWCKITNLQERLARNKRGAAA